MTTSKAPVEGSLNTVAEANENTVARLIRKRYGIGMLLVLVLWVPLGSLSILESVTGNVFLLDTYLQLCFLTVANTMAIVFAIGINRVLNKRFSGKWIAQWLGDGGRPWQQKQYVTAVLLSSVTPLLLAFFYGSDFSGYFYAGEKVVSLWMHLLGSMGSIIVGVVLAGLLMKLLGYIKCWIFGSKPDTANYLPFEQVDRTGAFTKSYTPNRLSLIHI